MDFEIYWTSLAELSYAEEIEFIFKKWNGAEVSEFVILVENFISQLTQYPYLGKKVSQHKVHCFVVSKQTSIYYKVYPDLQRIDLLLFHNNKRYPGNLSKLF